MSRWEDSQYIWWGVSHEQQFKNVMYRLSKANQLKKQIEKKQKPN